MNTAEILKAARAKITNPDNWMKGYYARDVNGVEMIGNEPGAVCFCSIGAIENVTGVVHLGKGWPTRALELLDKVAKEVQPEDKNYRNVAEYNDNTTHENVLAVFDKAIALAEAEPNV